jgi:uncharacterized coiled-coil DUF342 family protein
MSEPLTDEQVETAASRARHTPLSADPYTRGLAEQIDLLVAEVRRLRDWIAPVVMERDAAVTELRQVEACRDRYQAALETFVAAWHAWHKYPGVALDEDTIEAAWGLVRALAGEETKT